MYSYPNCQQTDIDAKNIDVQVTREAVLLAGEHRPEKESNSAGIFKSEFRYGSFRRVIPLPVAVENDKVQAEYQDGILTLSLPKVAAVRNQAVKVNVAQLNQSSPASTEETASEVTDKYSDDIW